MVSIIIPIHNRLELTQRCIESIFACTPNFSGEILAWDDGSTDGTLDYLHDMAEAYDRFRVFHTNKPIGVTHSCSFLSLEAQDDIIVYMNNDVAILGQNWWDAPLAALENPEVGLVGHLGQFFDASDGSYVEADFGEVDGVSGYCQFFKRELLAKGLMLDRNYGNSWYDDIDFCFQVRKLGYQVWRVDFPIYHKYHGSWDKTRAEHNKQYFIQKWSGFESCRGNNGH